MGEPSLGTSPSERPLEDRLDSWKEIASYLNRDVTTVQRWEKREGMPVHRHVHDKRGSVYALPEELDEWVKSRSTQMEELEKPEAEMPPTAPSGDVEVAARKTRPWFALGAILCICLAAAGWLIFWHRTTATVEPKIRSLAVLPLRNLSGDPAQDYLADGITEALIGQLANIRDLRVISHTSVMRFKDTQLSIPEIAKTLGVDAVVEGSVMKEGDRIRVTAQLIHGPTDEHFWSETYDREMRDALTLESELALAIGKKVEVTVTGEEQQRLSVARPVAPEVYESYLMGRFVFRQGNRAALEQSIQYFEDALTKDPTFAPAYVGLAEAYTMLGTVFAGMPPQATRPKVTDYARKALALDPDLVEAHVALADVLQEEWHWSEAEAEYKRALELNPNNADAHSWFALWLSCQGRTREAVAEIERARALDPVGIVGNSGTWMLNSGSWILFQSHRFDDAIRESRSALAVRPDNANNLLGLGFSLIANHQPAEAITPLEKALTISRGSPAVIGVLIRAYAHAGRRSDALRLLAELNQRRKAGYIPAGAFVNAYLGLGDNEQAFYWLEAGLHRAVEYLAVPQDASIFRPHPRRPAIRCFGSAGWAWLIPPD